MKKCAIKICGVRTLAIAQECENLGVEYIGLNFVPSSKRLVEIEVAREICDKINGVTKVGVFQNQMIDEVNQIAKYVGLDMVQFSGEESCDELNQCVCPVIKGISIKGGGALALTEQFRDSVEWILFDGPEPGSGERFDWKQTVDYKGKFFVAGGLNAENVAGAIRELDPDGVDVASGIEVDGLIDPWRLRKFVKQVRKSIPN